MKQQPRRRRADPRARSARMSTRESASSTQSTGTSWIRSPRRCASTSSSVSKNHSSSCTSGSSSRATSARIALKPHCASLKRDPQREPQQAVVAAGDQLALEAAPHTRAASAAACRSPGRCGPRAAARPGAAALRGRSRDRRPCSTARARRSPTMPRRSARPRPFGRDVDRLDAVSEYVSRRASASVPSVLALSAITICHENGK